MPLSFRQAGNLFVAGPNIGIYPSGNSFAISGSASGGGGAIISGTNLGTGIAVFSGVSGTNMLFRTIRAGSNAGVFLSGNDIIFSATTGTINGVTAVTNVGGGIIVASSVTSGALISRTISGSGGIDVIESGNLVVVRPSSTLTANRFLIAGTGGAITTNEAYQVDASLGTMALGFSTSQSNTTTRLLLAQGSSTISQIRFTAFAARYLSATAGDIFYNSTSGNSLFFNKTTTLQTPFIFKDNNFSLTSSSLTFRILETDTGGTINAVRNFQEFGVFNSITSTTISGTAELNVFNTGTTVLVGTSILKASSDSVNPQLVTGKKFRFNARGTIETTASAGNLIARMKLGSVLIASSSTSLQDSISANSYFEINGTFTIRSQGNTGVVLGSAYMLTDNNNFVSGGSNTVGVRAITTTGSTIATTADTAFNFTLQNETQANNIYVINEATLEYLN